MLYLVGRQTTAAEPARLPLAEVVAEALARNPADHRGAATSRRGAPAAGSGTQPSGPDGFGRLQRQRQPLAGAGLGTEPTANIGVMVSQELPYPGKRDLRASIASREADAAFQDIEAARLSVVARVKQAYYRLAYTYAVSDVLDPEQRPPRHAAEGQRGPLRGRSGRAAGRLQGADAAQHPRTAKLERVRQERATREGELNALLNSAGHHAIGRPEDLQLTPFDATLDSLVAAATDTHRCCAATRS